MLILSAISGIPIAVAMFQFLANRLGDSGLPGLGVVGARGLSSVLTHSGAAGNESSVWLVPQRCV